jgi:hypothetical protein
LCHRREAGIERRLGQQSSLDRFLARREQRALERGDLDVRALEAVPVLGQLRVVGARFAQDRLRRAAFVRMLVEQRLCRLAGDDAILTMRSRNRREIWAQRSSRRSATFPNDVVDDVAWLTVGRTGPDGPRRLGDPIGSRRRSGRRLVLAHITDPGDRSTWLGESIGVPLELMNHPPLTRADLLTAL